MRHRRRKKVIILFLLRDCEAKIQKTVLLVTTDVDVDAQGGNLGNNESHFDPMCTLARRRLEEVVEQLDVSALLTS